MMQFNPEFTSARSLPAAALSQKAGAVVQNSGFILGGTVESVADAKMTPFGEKGSKTIALFQV